MTESAVRLLSLSALLACDEADADTGEVVARERPRKLDALEGLAVGAGIPPMRGGIPYEEW
jgi:hypothetical protein